MIENIEHCLAIRKEAALKIDPKAALVRWSYVYTLDPYGVRPDLPEDSQQIGPEYFARAPGSDVWVWFGDLPESVRDELLRRTESDRIEEPWPFDDRSKVQVRLRDRLRLRDRYPKQFLDELRARLPVSEVVGQRVELYAAEREGERKGLSPFVKEAKPSLYETTKHGGGSISLPAKAATSSISLWRPRA